MNAVSLDKRRESPSKEEKMPNEMSNEKITLKIGGMSCAACAQKIEKSQAVIKL